MEIIQVVIRQCSRARLRFSSSQSAPLQGFPLALAATPRLGRMYVRARLPFIYAAWDDATMAAQVRLGVVLAWARVRTEIAPAYSH